MFPYCLYHLQYSLVSIYNLSVRKYLFITTSLQPLVYRSVNLVGIPRSSSCSSSSNYLAFSIPTLGLFITFCTSALSLVRPNIANLWSSFCSYYAIIYYLNLSMLSYFLRLAVRFLKSSYFLIAVLTF